MAFKDLKKRVSITQEVQQQGRLFERIQDKPFWIWDQPHYRSTEGRWCRKPIFDYEKKIFAALESHKHVWIKKATGLEITEYFLRYLAWVCLRNDDYRNSQICIVTGPNIDMAIRLIKRLKTLRQNTILFLAIKKLFLELNRCVIEAFPSNHLDSYRALDNPKFILLDEADFFLLLSPGGHY